MCGDSQDDRAKTFSLSDTDVLFIIYLMNRTWEKQVVKPSQSPCALSFKNFNNS